MLRGEVVIPVVSVGHSFLGVFNYHAKKGSEAEILWTNTFANELKNPKAMAREFIQLSKVSNRSYKKSVVHISLSPTDEDLKNKTVDDYVEFAHLFMKKNGWNKGLYTVIANRDSGRFHVHIITSRFDLDNQKVDDAFEKYRMSRCARECERELGWELVSKSPDKTSLAPKWQKEKALSQHDYILDVIAFAASTSPTIIDYLDCVTSSGVEVRATFKHGKPGFSYKFENYSLSGAKSGGSLRLLQEKNGVKYDPAYDETIREICRRSKEGEHTVQVGIESGHLQQQHNDENSIERSNTFRTESRDDAIKESRISDREFEGRDLVRTKSRNDERVDELHEAVKRRFDESYQGIRSALDETAKQTISISKQTTELVDELREQRGLIQLIREGFEGAKRIFRDLSEGARAIKNSIEQTAWNRGLDSQEILSEEDQYFLNHIRSLTGLNPADPHQHYQAIFNVLPIKRQEEIQRSILRNDLSGITAWFVQDEMKGRNYLEMLNKKKIQVWIQDGATLVQPTSHGLTSRGSSLDY